MGSGVEGCNKFCSANTQGCRLSSNDKLEATIVLLIEKFCDLCAESTCFQPIPLNITDTADNAVFYFKTGERRKFHGGAIWIYNSRVNVFAGLNFGSREYRVFHFDDRFFGSFYER